MARIERFDIDPDREIARAILNSQSDSAQRLRALGQLVGIEYRRQARKFINERGYGSASSPFEGKEHLSITDPAAFRVDIDASRGELILSVEAPAAGYAEEGNDGAEGNEYMKIKLKSGFQPKERKRKKSKKKGIKIKPNAFIKQENGRYYMYTRRVRPARGYNLLENAVRKIFG